MNKRMLDGNIWANEKFSDLPPMAALLQIGLINLADDQGRMKAHPAYLRSQIFPYRNVTANQISQWLALIVANGTAITYKVDDKEYIQLANWWDYQSHTFAAPSEYPRPDGWQDRVRFTGKSRIIYTCNWIITSGERLDDTCDQDGTPLPKPTKLLAPASNAPPSGARAQPVAPLIEDKDKEEDKDHSSGANAEEAATPTEPTLSEMVFDRLEDEWSTVNPGQMDNHLALAERYGYRAWVAGLERVSRGKRSNKAYVEKAILSAIDDKPSLEKPKPKPPPAYQYFITDPVTGVRKEVMM